MEGKSAGDEGNVLRAVLEMARVSQERNQAEVQNVSGCAFLLNCPAVSCGFFYRTYYISILMMRKRIM